MGNKLLFSDGFWLQKHVKCPSLSITYCRKLKTDSQKLCNFAAVKIVRTSFLPFHGFSAVNLLGVLFVHPGVYLSNEMMNHERIHSAQQREMLFVFFYLAYVIEWMVRLPMRGNAYRNISFEREAYANQRNLDYLNSRRPYSWRRYMKRARR